MEKREYLKQSILCCELLLSQVHRDCDIPRNRFEGRMADELRRIRHEQVAQVEEIRNFLLSII